MLPVQKLPWDYTLLALQNILVHNIAPWAVGLAFAGSMVLYAVGEHDERAASLLGSSIGGLIAFALVYFLNYVAF